MTKEEKQTTVPTCEQCGQGNMYYSSDGRARVCERCGVRVPVKLTRPSLDRLKDETEPLPFTMSDAYRSGQVGNLRLTLVNGIGAARQGDWEEAYAKLTRIVRTAGEETLRERAWYWLAQIMKTPEEKRYCLEHLLALNPFHGSARREMAILDGRLQPSEIIDPNQIATLPSNDVAPIDAQQFSCPRCHAPLSFSPETDELLCEHCHYRQAVPEASASAAQFGEGRFEQEFTLAMATAKGHVHPEQMRTFQCARCVVDFVLAPETISLTCVYCGAVYVTESAEMQQLLPPQALIPFAVTEDEAHAAVRQWLKQQYLKPSQLGPLLGAYTPVWTFDISCYLPWTGYVRAHGNQYRRANGVLTHFEDDVLVPAQAQQWARMTEKAQQFDWRDLVAYEPSFLADWPAERYQIPLAEASLAARKEARSALKRKMQSIGHHQDVRNMKVQGGNVTIDSYKLILLPIWHQVYQIEGKRYQLGVNGQTGRVSGELPQQDVLAFIGRRLKGLVR